MNIKQANCIPIREVLAKLGFFPVLSRKNGDDLWYCSPFRPDEKDPSFHIHVRQNTWKDFGHGPGGKVLDFVIQFKSLDVKEALEWLRDNFQAPHIDFSAPVSAPKTPEYDLALLKVTELRHDALLQYLKCRNIPLEFAKQLLKEVHFSNRKTGRSYFALGFPNVNRGYELRNPVGFKGQIGVKSISFFQGHNRKICHVFEGFFDFLSVVAWKGHLPESDCIVLNSASFLSYAEKLMATNSYETVYSWFDNDKTGERMNEELSKDFNLVQMNDVYQGFEDVNHWWKEQ